MTAQPRGGRRWGWWFALAPLVVPSIEIAVIVWVGSQIGGWPTLGLLLAESALGAWLVRREGSRTWSALAAALRSGRMPSRQLADAALVLVGGVLLLTPGFLTDLVGFAFILPVTRPLARGVLEVAVARRLLAGSGWAAPGGAAPGRAAPGGAGRPGRGGGDRPGGDSGEVIEGEIIDP